MIINEETDATVRITARSAMVIVFDTIVLKAAYINNNVKIEKDKTAFIKFKPNVFGKNFFTIFLIFATLSS